LLKLHIMNIEEVNISQQQNVMANYLIQAKYHDFDLFCRSRGYLTEHVFGLCISCIIGDTGILNTLLTRYSVSKNCSFYFNFPLFLAAKYDNINIIVLLLKQKQVTQSLIKTAYFTTSSILIQHLLLLKIYPFAKREIALLYTKKNQTKDEAFLEIKQNYDQKIRKLLELLYKTFVAYNIPTALLINTSYYFT